MKKVVFTRSILLVLALLVLGAEDSASRATAATYFASDYSLLDPRPGLVLFVDADAQPDGNGASWSAALRDLQEALAIAAQSYGKVTEIWVANGIYTPDSGTGDRSATFRLLDGLAIYGGFEGADSVDYPGGETERGQRDPAENLTVLSGDLLGDDDADPAAIGDNSRHVVTISETGRTAVLDGFIITGGHADGEDGQRGGAGILIVSASPTIVNCTITGNTTGNAGGNRLEGGGGVNGGGIYGTFCSPKLVNCRISGNRTGGGESTLDAYIGGRGGAGTGIYFSYSTPEIIGCEISGNLTGDGGEGFDQGGAGGGGAGLYLSNCPSALIAESTISGNVTGKGGNAFASAGYGGDGAGIFCDSSSANIRNCVIKDNLTGAGGFDSEFGGSAGNGAGIYLLSCSGISIEGCRISGNKTADGRFGYTGGGSGGSGAGVYLSSCDRVEIIESNINDNVTGDGGETTTLAGGPGGSGAGIFSLSSSLVIKGCAIQGNTTGVGGAADRDQIGAGGNGGSGAGICLTGGSTILMNRSNIVGNRTGGGGYGVRRGGDGGSGAGVYINRGSVGVIGLCEIGNNVTGNGGDAYAWRRGSGGSGAGVFCSDALLTVKGSFVDGNVTGSGGSAANGMAEGGEGGSGAGVFCAENSTLFVANCTIVDNTASNGGGPSGAHGQTGGVRSLASSSITNTILWGNHDGYVGTQSAQVSGIVRVNYSCVQGLTGSLGGPGNIGDDPLFANAENGGDGHRPLSRSRYQLALGSPCIDAGRNLEGLGEDCDGTPRPYDGDGRGAGSTGDGSEFDIGADEYSDTFLSFAFGEDPGWATEGEWRFGSPTGQGGMLYGYPDPGAGATGENVYGVNLSGDYLPVPGGPYYLTAGPFDFTGRENVTLRFRRWLNTDSERVDAEVAVSSDGDNWTLIWHSPPDAPVTDRSWVECVYDISDQVDNQPAAYVRWGYSVRQGAKRYSGWNIDDVVFLSDASVPILKPVLIESSAALGRSQTYRIGIQVDGISRIKAYTFDLVYDSSKLEFQSVSRVGTLSQSFWLVGGNEVSPGRARITGAALAADPITEPGRLLYVDLRAKVGSEGPALVLTDRPLADLSGATTGCTVINIAQESRNTGELAPLTPTPTVTLTPTPTVTPTPALRPAPWVAVTDDMLHSEDLSGGVVDFDSPEERMLVIRWRLPEAAYKDIHVYVKGRVGGYQYLGHTGDGEAAHLVWAEDSPGIQRRFAEGPVFGELYRFRVYGITVSGTPLFLGPWETSGTVQFESQ